MRQPKSSAGAERRFACTHDGCNRAFTRHEHLQRHYQNHAGGDFTCDRCRAHFKRRDLLDRHKARHEQKDAEGSSLMTRKRSWKDADGNIVAKKPHVDSDLDANKPRDENIQIETVPLPSPPLSYGNSEIPVQESVNPEAIQGALPFMQDQSNTIDFDDTLLGSGNLLADDPGNTVGDNLFEDAFNPDTASSFNMPYTTMNNYNWLFDLDTGLGNDLTFEDIDCNFFPPMVPNAPSNELMDMSLCNLPMDVNQTQQQTPENRVPNVQHETYRNSQPSQASSSSEASSADSRSSKASPTTKATSVSSAEPGRKSRSAAPSRRAALPPGLERPMTLMSANTRLPKLDALARSHIVQLIAEVRPVTPTGDYITPDHSFLSLSALQIYSDLFFTRFNATYPLIHIASFEPAKADTLLLLSVLLLGATYCEKDAHQIAVCIHDVLRPKIFAHSSFSAAPELWMLQTILLVECFGKSRAGQKQHDMSHLFHGLLINLIRRSDCQIVKPEATTEITGDLEDEWRAWIDAEQKKRLALLCFMWDTQHAVLFCQSLCMSAFELRCALPCDQSIWEADSAESWQKLRRAQSPPPLFLSVLKSHIGAQVPAAIRKLNGLSRVLLLHGLMSIAWDMNRRDQTSLGVVGANMLDGWKHRIASSYDSWKADFDAYVMSVTQTLSQSSSCMTPAEYQETRKGFAIYATANSALYHAAYVILFSEFLDIQIYAGARHLLGRPVRREDFARSQRVVKRWANEQSLYASKAAWHAAHIIKEAVMNLEDFDAGGLFIHPWCLYLATITIWSFHHARPGGKQNKGSEDDEDEMIWDAQADMNALIGSMTSCTAEQLSSSIANNRGMSTAGLTAVISKQLGKIRWAVVRDGMLVLKGLVPWRLINDTEV